MNLNQPPPQEQRIARLEGAVLVLMLIESIRLLASILG